MPLVLRRGAPSSVREKMRRHLERHRVEPETEPYPRRVSEYFTDGVVYRSRSLGMWTVNDSVRRHAIDLVDSRPFQRFMFAVVVLHSLSMVLYVPSVGGAKNRTASVSTSDSSPSSLNQVLNWLNLGFLAVYTLEAGLKITAMGFVLHKHAYLRSGWNCLDFLLVVVSVTSMLSFNGLDIFAPFWVLRALRPLQSVSRMQGLRIVVQSLVSALPALRDVGYFFAFLIGWFAIVGVQLMSGALRRRCVDPSALAAGTLPDMATLRARRPCGIDPTAGYLCPAPLVCRDVGSAANPNSGFVSFDHLGSAFVVLFNVATLDGWSAIMYALQDAWSTWAWVYFVPYTFITAFLATNMILAVLDEAFHLTAALEELTDNDEVVLVVDDADAIMLSHLNLWRSGSGSKLVSAMTPIGKPATPGRSPGTSPGRLSVPASPHGTSHDQEQQEEESMETMGHPHESLTSDVCYDGEEEEQSWSSTSSFPPDSTSSNEYSSYVYSTRSTGGQVLSDSLVSETNIRAIDESVSSVTESITTTSTNDSPPETRRAPSPPPQISRLRPLRKASESSSAEPGVAGQAAVALDDVELGVVSLDVPAVMIENETGQTRTSSMCNGGSGGKCGGGESTHADDDGSGSHISTASIDDVSYLDVISSVVVLVDFVLMLTDHAAASHEYLVFLDVASYTCLGFYGIEFSARLAQASSKAKFLKSWSSLWDGVILALGLLEAVLVFGSGMPRARMLRPLRVFKLTRAWGTFRRVVTGVLLPGRMVSYLISLLFLLLYVYALAGVRFFGHAYSAGPGRASFDSAYWAFLAVFQAFTGDSVTDLIYEGMRVDAVYGFFFFASLIVLGSYVIFSLFLAIILEKFANIDKADAPDAGTTKSAALLAEDAASAKRRRRRHIQARISAWSYDQPLVGTTLRAFGPESRVRRFAQWVVTHQAFSPLILVVTVADAAVLAVDDPAQAGKTTLLGNISAAVVLLVFGLEAVGKIIVRGLWYPSRSAYLRNGWNCLDLFIVLTSLVAHAAGPALPWSWALRALRPLRLVSRLAPLRTTVYALLAASRAIASVVAVALVFWAVFAIVGVALFKGRLYSCNDASVTWRGECVGSFVDAATNQTVARTWSNAVSTFDSVPDAMLSLFECSVMVGWVDIMLPTIDIVGPDLQPQPRSQPAAALYFVVFIVIGSMLVVNLVVAVVIENFDRLRDEISGHAFLTDSQREWLTIQRIISATPPYEAFVLPDHPVRAVAYIIVKHRNFSKLVMGALALNGVVLASFYADAPDELRSFQSGISYFFVAFFCVEAGLHMAASGLNHYLLDGWHRFEFSSSSYDSLINLIGSLQLLRFFQIVPLLASILSTFRHALVAIANVAGLLVLVLFVYALMGRSLWGQVVTAPYGQAGPGFGPHANFATFGNACLTVYRIATVDSWGAVMRHAEVQPPFCSSANPDTCGSVYAPAYFVSLIVISSWILLNLFIAVVLEHYHAMSECLDAVMLESVESFRRLWMVLDPEPRGRISPAGFLQLMFSLKPPLGWVPNMPDVRVLRHLQAMDIKVNLYPATRTLFGRFRYDAFKTAPPSVDYRNTFEAVIRYAVEHQDGFLTHCADAVKPTGTDDEVAEDEMFRARLLLHSKYRKRAYLRARKLPLTHEDAHITMAHYFACQIISYYWVKYRHVVIRHNRLRKVKRVGMLLRAASKLRWLRGRSAGLGASSSEPTLTTVDEISEGSGGGAALRGARMLPQHPTTSVSSIGDSSQQLVRRRGDGESGAGVSTADRAWAAAMGKLPASNISATPAASAAQSRARGLGSSSRGRSHIAFSLAALADSKARNTSLKRVEDGADQLHRLPIEQVDADVSYSSTDDIIDASMSMSDEHDGHRGSSGGGVGRGGGGRRGSRAHVSFGSRSSHSSGAGGGFNWARIRMLASAARK
ncbi:uncharacterized protein AMSG_06944 [Thecamonas trahens ATCC 50062]|uniref:Ion transport domain-containing protein n=1 Tax=Thecamonas trahens ATCC 50062 TaxID=461836 RepID=A0A0L0DF55_THETB|nr:hypothetical protein AMSG_06944 [Thecamonas trahens ATCC 50062]KNC50977.1 hypothetical protein AMSG_06944 [Thecamonas trahens ATCC 50062]|eukprot:XP_013756448.1 hypothetical protein AMSG_06944 [Thecamonas trahens ATCC 50062]